MDRPEPETKVPEPAAAPKTLASLDKDVLIEKCKGLLQVAKSAKQKKDEYAAENVRLKESMDTLTRQRTEDKENLGKLQASLRKLNDTVAILEEQKQLDKDYMKGIQAMVDELTDEKQSLAGRVTRLTEDNASLLDDCRKSDGILRQLNDSMAEHQRQVQQLQQMCEQQKSINGDLRKQLAAECSRTADVSGQLDAVQADLVAVRRQCHAEHETKLKFYRGRLVSFSGQLKKLRVSKDVLLETVKEYSQAVSQWQADIVNASGAFLQRNRLLSDENGALVQRTHELNACKQRIAELSDRLAGPASVEDDRIGDAAAQQSACYEQMLRTLDESLLEIGRESERLIGQHRRERELLEQRCAELEQAAEGERSARQQEFGELQAKLSRADAQQADDHATLVRERDTLIEKGQHLIEMVSELQQNLLRSDGELQSMHDVHANRVAEHEASVEGLRTKLSEITDELSAKTEQFDRLTAELTGKGNERAAEVVALESQLAALRSDVAEKASAIEARQAEIVELRENVRQEQTQVQHVRGELDEYRAAYDRNLEDGTNELENALLTKNSECALLLSELEKLRLVSESKSEQLVGLETELTAVRLDLAGKVSSIDTYEFEMQARRAEIAELNETINKERDQMQKLHDELEALRASCEKNLADGLIALEKTLLAKTTECEQLVSDLDTQKLAFQSQLEQLTSLESELSAARTEISDQSKEMETNRVDIAAKEAQIAELNETIAKEQSQVLSLRSDLAEKSEQLASSESDLSAAKNEITENTSAIDKKNAEITELHANLDEVQRLVETLRNSYETLQNSLARNVADGLGEMSQVLQAKTDESVALQTQLRELQQSEQAKSGELLALQQQLSVAYEERERARSDIAVQQSGIDELHATVQTLRDDNAALKQRLDRMIADLQGKQDECSALQAKLDELTQTDQSANKQLASLQAKLSKSESEAEDKNNANRAKIDELKTKITALQAQLSDQKQHDQSSNDELGSLKSKLAASVLELDELKQNIAYQETLVETLSNNVTALHTKNNVLEAQLAEQNKTTGDQLDALRLQLSSTESESAASKHTIAQDVAEIDRLTETIKRQAAQIETLQQDVAASQANLERSVSDGLSELRSALQAKSSELDSLTPKHAELLKQHAASGEQLKLLQAQLAEAKADTIVRAHTLDAKTAQIADLLEAAKHEQTVMQKMRAEIEALQRAAAERGQSDDKEVAELRDCVRSSAAQFAESDAQCVQLRQQVDDLSAQLADRAAQLQSVEQQLSAANARQTDAAERLANALAELSASRSEVEQARSERDQLVESKTREMDDLLTEMRELNEALRNRGDVISKQEQRLATIGGDLAKSTQDLERMTAERIGLQEKLADLELAASRAGAPVVPIADDQLSTSTISKADESLRMRDIEDSFEEKYNKLRQLAVKLKRKCSEQAQQLLELEANGGGKTANAAASTTADSQQARNLQSMQKDYDRVADELDQTRAERNGLAERNASLAAQLDELNGELVAAKLRNEELRSGAKAGSSQTQELERAVKEFGKQIQSLKDELRQSRQQQQSSEAELATLKSELHSKREEFEKQAAETKALKSSLKKTNVLSLEIEAQEKSLLDMSAKLDARTAQVEELKTNLEQQKNSIESLKQQIRTMESELQSEQEHSAELKIQVTTKQARLNESELARAELQKSLDEMHRSKLLTDEELLDLRSAATQNSGDAAREIAQLRVEVQLQQQRTADASERSADAQRTLRDTDAELQALRAEFVAYKVRAQSLLRQSQQHEKNSSRESELEDELAMANATTAALDVKLAGVQQRARQLEQQSSELQAEIERLRAHGKQLMQVADEARANADAAQADAAQANAEHLDAMRAVRLQCETLNACYKKELADLSSAHEASRQQLQQQVKQLTAAAALAPRDAEASSGGGQRRDVEQLLRSTEWRLTERQAGEGSESSQPISGGRTAGRKWSSSTLTGGGGAHHRELIPLDELLNSTFQSSAEDEELDFDGDGSQDSEATRQKLLVQESRVKHLTTLLAESEQDTARLTQLNDALKEELRRQERSVEREQHLHNLEYLKNVMFKFLTISNGDEKVHLVPVLNTMLKLSPDETQKLQAVAKGSESSLSGWGKYLPI